MEVEDRTRRGVPMAVLSLAPPLITPQRALITANPNLPNVHSTPITRHSPHLSSCSHQSVLRACIRTGRTGRGLVCLYALHHRSG